LLYTVSGFTLAFQNRKGCGEKKKDSRPWALNEQLGKVEIGGRLGMSKPSQTKRGEEGELGLSEYYTNITDGLRV